VNPDSCGGRGVSGGGIGFATGAGAGASLPRVRSNSVNPAFPLPAGSAAGAFSTLDALSADALRIRSSNSGELSAPPPPNTTLCTTGAARGFATGAAGVTGATGCGLAVSGGRSSAARGSASEPGVTPFTGSGGFTVLNTPVAPKPCSDPGSSGHGEFGALGPPGVVGLSILPRPPGQCR